MQPLLQQWDYPKDDLSGAGGGVRLATTIGRIDLAAYYHYGLAPTPVLFVDPDFADKLSSVDWSTISASMDQLIADMVATQPFQTRWVRRHHVGLDGHSEGRRA
jgi:hypothetical protein